MKRLAICALALALAACGRSNENESRVYLGTQIGPPPPPNLAAPPPPFVPAPAINIVSRPNAVFGQQHSLTVSMPHDSVAPRLQAARDACLNDRALQCTLTSASLNITTSVSANLEVALPHDEVANFEKRLLKHISQDGSGKVEVTSRSTSIENQTQTAADVERQLSQAIAYRDTLEELAKRSNLTVDEVIKIHSELLDAQQTVENAEEAKRVSDSKIVLEQLDITLAEASTPETVSPFAGFWKNASDILAFSTADMLLRIVNALPWVPIIGVVLLLVARIFRRAPRMKM